MHSQGLQHPSAALIPRQENPQRSPKIPAEPWQCHSLQSEKGPRPKTQDFSPEPLTLKAPIPPARHLTERRRGTQPCSPAFCHVPRPPSSAVEQPPSNSSAGPDPALGGQGGTRWMQGSPADTLQGKGDRPSFTAPGCRVGNSGRSAGASRDCLVHNPCIPISGSLDPLSLMQTRPSEGKGLRTKRGPSPWAGVGPVEPHGSWREQGQRQGRAGRCSARSWAMLGEHISTGALHPGAHLEP